MDTGTTNMRQLPRYKSHKEVWALKIKAIVPPLNGGNAGMHRVLEWEDSQYAPMPVPENWIERHKPDVGGYYVQYADGYTSYSPAKAFEEGYTPMQAAKPVRTHRYSSERITKQIVNAFTYHAPKDDQADRYTTLRDIARDFAVLLSTYCPESRELSLAMTKLEETVMWANAAIARNE